MKLHKLTIALGILGSMLVLGSIIWFFIYKDFSQCFIAFLLGMVIIVFAYLYWWIRRHDEKDEELQGQNAKEHEELKEATDRNNMYIRDEVEKVNKKK